MEGEVSLTFLRPWPGSVCYFCVLLLPPLDLPNTSNLTSSIAQTVGIFMLVLEFQNNFVVNDISK